MTRKDVFKNELLMKIRYKLDTNELAMLDNVLSECLAFIHRCFFVLEIVKNRV